MLLNCRENKLILAEYQKSRYTYLSLTKMNRLKSVLLSLVPSMELFFFGNEPIVYWLITHFLWKLQLNRKGYEIGTRCSKLKKLMNVHAESDGDSKSKLYLKLSRKEHYSLFSKGKKILNIRIIVCVYVHVVPLSSFWYCNLKLYLLVECLITLIPF